MDIVRRDELALLDVDNAAGASGFEQQIGLAAKERGDLQDVDDFGCRRRLRGFVNVGEDGEAFRLGREDAQSFCEAGAAISGEAAAIGFVE